MRFIIKNDKIEFWRGLHRAVYPRSNHTIALVWSIALACSLQLTYLSCDVVVFQEFLA